MKGFSTVVAAGLVALAATGAAKADDAALEKTKIAIAVGGSISQMNKVAYAIALARKYFEQEGLTIDSTAFASGTAGLQSLVAGGAEQGNNAPVIGVAAGDGLERFGNDQRDVHRAQSSGSTGTIGRSSPAR